MIVSLYPLILLIETLDHMSEVELPHRLAAITSACKDNFVEALTAYRQYQDAVTTSRAVKLYHIQLLRLHQKLYSYCGTYHSPDQTALGALEELLERIEFLFKNDIDPKTMLACHHQQKVKAYIARHIDEVCAKLLEKQIPEVYLKEIRCAFESLFEETKLPYLQYYHQDYLIQLMDALRQLANDGRNHKNWHYRFLVLMINFNFNHMGFFNRWKTLYAEAPSDMESMLRFPKHFSCIPGFAYDCNRSSLLKLMCEYIHAENNPMLKTESEHSLQFIHSNLNGKELKLWMHLAVKAGLTMSTEKKEVALEFSKLIKTREGTLLSPHSLTKMDKGAEYFTAVRVRKQLNAMLAELHRQFPELDR